MRFLLALWLSKLAAALITLIDPSRGTDFPGKLAYRIDPDFMLGFENIDPEKVIFITGTNGKSTTTNLLYHTLRQSGKKVIANLSGSNMLNGAASVLIRGSDMRGNIDADYILIEVDERSFPYIIKQLRGKNIVITNLMQDQVHRNGDPDFIYQLLRKNVLKDMRMFLNNDEPRSKSFEDLAGEICYFGVAKTAVSYNKDNQYDVTEPCPYCHSRIEFDYMNSADVGSFKCTNCSFRSSETNLTQVDSVNFAEKVFEINGVKHKMPYDAPIMLYNYASVSSVCHFAGLTDEQISAAYTSFVNVEGRNDELHYGGKTIYYLRSKQGNPETIQMCIDAIAMDPQEKLVVLGLCIIPERRPKFVPHYTNTYYAYEADFTPLKAVPSRILVFSEYVALDQVNRLLYDGFNMENIDVIDSETPSVILGEIAKSPYDKIYMIAPLRNIKIFKKFIKSGGRS